MAGGANSSWAEVVAISLLWTACGGPDVIRVEPCSTEEICSDGEDNNCDGIIDEYCRGVCMPGTTYCVGGEAGHPYLCDDLGIPATRVGTCAAFEYCANGICHADLCAQGTTYCRDGSAGQPFLCDATGSHQTQSDTCTESEYCSLGACVTNLCPAGYVGDGATCTDCDECTGECGGHLCSTYRTCSNTAGSYACDCNPLANPLLSNPDDQCGPSAPDITVTFTPLAGATHTVEFFDGANWMAVDDQQTDRATQWAVPAGTGYKFRIATVADGCFSIAYSETAVFAVVLNPEVPYGGGYRPPTLFEGNMFEMWCSYPPGKGNVGARVNGSPCTYTSYHSNAYHFACNAPFTAPAPNTFECFVTPTATECARADSLPPLVASILTAPAPATPPLPNTCGNYPHCLWHGMVHYNGGIVASSDPTKRGFRSLPDVIHDMTAYRPSLQNHFNDIRSTMHARAIRILINEYVMRVPMPTGEEKIALNQLIDDASSAGLDVFLNLMPPDRIVIENTEPTDMDGDGHTLLENHIAWLTEIVSSVGASRFSDRINYVDFFGDFSHAFPWLSGVENGHVISWWKSIWGSIGGAQGFSGIVPQEKKTFEITGNPSNPLDPSYGVPQNLIWVRDQIAANGYAEPAKYGVALYSSHDWAHSAACTVSASPYDCYDKLIDAVASAAGGYDRYIVEEMGVSTSSGQDLYAGSSYETNDQEEGNETYNLLFYHVLQHSPDTPISVWYYQDHGLNLDGIWGLREKSGTLRSGWWLTAHYFAY